MSSTPAAADRAPRIDDSGTPLTAADVAASWQAIVPPPDGEIVATPERRREVDDRDYLLQGIAPPLRRNPDGTAATPQPGTAPPPPAQPGATPPAPARPEPKARP